MNVNEKIRTLEDVTGYPVRPDIYTGGEDKYITFTYEDERPALVADLQVTLYTPEDFNYFSDKKKIKKHLKEQGFNVESIQSWLDDAKTGTKKTRHTVFIVNITEAVED